MCDARWNQRVSDERRREDDAARRGRAASRARNSAADRGDQVSDVDDERRQALVEHVREGVDVARQARDDPARLLLREVAQRERVRWSKRSRAQVEHHRAGRCRRAPPRAIACSTHAVSADGDVDDDVECQARVVVRADAVVDRVADDRPAGDGRARGDAGEQRDEREAAARDRSCSATGGTVLCGLAYAATASSPNSAVKTPPCASEILRATLLDDAAAIEHDGAVRDDDGREPLPGDEHGAARRARGVGSRRGGARSRCRRPTSDRRARRRVRLRSARARGPRAGAGRRRGSRRARR